MNSPQDKSNPVENINEIRETEEFRNPPPNLAAKLIGADPNSKIEFEEQQSLESGTIFDERHFRRTKRTWHWISVYTAWVAWIAAMFSGVAVLLVFLWNYLVPDRLAWLSPEKISDLKFIIGVTAINAAGLYIQWFKSNRAK